MEPHVYVPMSGNGDPCFICLHSQHECETTFHPKYYFYCGPCGSTKHINSMVVQRGLCAECVEKLEQMSNAD